METTKRLQIINGETNIQKRLKLLVDHDFVAEAGQLIRDLVHAHTAMFHYDWHDQKFCQPLPRVTKESSGVYVIITSNNKLDYHPYHRKEGEWHIVFELGWERKALGWTKEESCQLVRAILAHAVARPLNQWSFKQAEGTGRAVRRLLPTDDSMAREVAAMHLVYQLREADFGHIYNYLADIKGFPYDSLMAERDGRDENLMNWIADQLLEFGWTPDRIRKEFVEWMWLKTSTWPQWLLAVAKAKVFADGDQSRVAAIRHWIRQGFDYMLDVVPRRDDGKKMAETYRQLFQIGQFGSDDNGWICNKLVERIAVGKVKSVEFFVEQFGKVLEVDPFDSMLVRALNTAANAGNYGIAVALAERGQQTPDPSWVEIVEIRELSTKLE